MGGKHLPSPELYRLRSYLALTRLPAALLLGQILTLGAVSASLGLWAEPCGGCHVGTCRTMRLPRTMWQ